MHLTGTTQSELSRLSGVRQPSIYGQKTGHRNQRFAYLLTADPVRVQFAKVPTSSASSNLLNAIRHWHSDGDSSHSGR
jgi:hypothetical protein